MWLTWRKPTVWKRWSHPIFEMIDGMSVDQLLENREMFTRLHHRAEVYAAQRWAILIFGEEDFKNHRDEALKLFCPILTYHSEQRKD